MSRTLTWRQRWFGPDARRRLRLGARRHWLFLVVVGAGLALRVVTQVAYRPALLFTDSYRYLENLHVLSPTRVSQPLGYVVLLLRPVLSVANLAVVVALQHVIGLAMGVAIYALLVRLGARHWVAVIGAAPVLLDAYQLQIEQNIMSETLLEAFVLAAVVLLLWRRPVTLPTLAAAGALFGLAMSVRVVAGVLVLPAVGFALVAGGGGRQRLVRAATIALAFAVPVGVYVGYYWVKTGDIGYSRGDAHLLYGRAATIVDCHSIDIPDYQRVLCPKEPLNRRLGVNDYAHHNNYPDQLDLPPDMGRDAVLRDFSRRVIVHQPLDFTKHVLTDFAKGFSWPRAEYAGDVPVDRWQFQLDYPTHGSDPVAATRRYGGGAPTVVEPLAVFLRGYQFSVGYLPGSVTALAFIAGLVAAAGVGRARRSGLRAACALPTLCGLCIVFAADVFEFSWRYQLPVLVLAPVGGALALTALTGWKEPSKSPPRTALRRPDSVRASAPVDERP